MRHFVFALMRTVFFRVVRRLFLRRGRPGQTAENGVCSVALLFSGKRNEFRSTKQVRAVRNVWSTTKQSRIWVGCCIWSRKNRAISPGRAGTPFKNWTSTVWTKNFNVAPKADVSLFFENDGTTV